MHPSNMKTGFLLGLLASSFQLVLGGYNAACNNNVFTYHGNGGAPNSQSLGYYCQNEGSNVDVFIASFAWTRDANGQPVFADSNNDCGVTGNCVGLGNDVKTCQSLGKTVLISIGGGTGDIVFSSPSDAQTFATNIWNSYLGGSGSRPFGNGVVFNGIDLDIENNNPPHWGDFTTKIRQLFATDTSRKYIISSAPQPEPIENQFCATPDLLTNAWFDVVFIQFYNNPGFEGPDTLAWWAWWDSWARQYESNGHNSMNPNVKIIYGLPGSSNTNDASDGYQTPSQAASQIANIKAKYPASFGGAGTWDDAWSYENTANGVNFLQSLKSTLGTCNSGSTSTPSSKTTSSTSKTSATTSPTTSSHVCPNSGVVCPQPNPCCSQWGYCGSTSDYCGSGCDPAASFGGKCVAASSVKNVVARSIVDLGKKSTAAVKKAPGSFAIYSLPLNSTTTSNIFQVTVRAGVKPILPNWKLQFPTGFTILNSTRGIINQKKGVSTIISKPSQEKLRSGSIQFVVRAPKSVTVLDVANATFSSL